MSQRTSDPKRLWGIDLPPDQSEVYVATNNFKTVHFDKDCQYLKKATGIDARPITSMNGAREPCAACGQESTPNTFECEWCGDDHRTKAAAFDCCIGGSE